MYQMVIARYPTHEMVATSFAYTIFFLMELQSVYLILTQRYCGKAN